MNELNKTQQTKLMKLVSVIRKGQQAFMDTATAVYEINKAKLYVPHKTLAKFCEEEFDLSANDTNRYRNAGALLVELKDFGVMPTNEGQCREFLKLSTTAEKVEAWTEVVRRHTEDGETITAKLIAKVIAGDAPEPVQSKTENTTDSPEPVQYKTENTTLRKVEEAYSAVENLSAMADDGELLTGLEQEQIDELAMTLKNIIVSVEELQEKMIAQSAQFSQAELAVV